jgi:uncharacterized protein (DUF1684 family)
MTEASWLDLYDWRRRVGAMHRDRDAALDRGEDSAVVLARFRAAKDRLFAGHRQSPIAAAARSTFAGLGYFPHDPGFRVEATLIPVRSAEVIAAPSSGAEAMPLRRAGEIAFSLAGARLRLSVFWIDVYGGGLFVPFRDMTAPAETYGAGRYLVDTVKGSDFQHAAAGREDAGGYGGGAVVVDFNYAYNPSCAYDPRWVCPLAPRENWLAVPVRAGERKPDA